MSLGKNNVVYTNSILKPISKSNFLVHFLKTQFSIAFRVGLTAPNSNFKV